MPPLLEHRAGLILHGVMMTRKLQQTGHSINLFIELFLCFGVTNWLETVSSVDHFATLSISQSSLLCLIINF